ncbi:MAG: hypothetical protein IPO60_11180 [Flavobacteriales bacterium]|jgi:hypothetical protein|nr:hypothetical protein [Flavobacteriales bacterium]MBK6891900.1 hypothetical protein [Flavobacteriales bacterium]MBK7288743.1 hypothetical protein [Flavobacteriales bacterium]MBK9598855.1 hypothetical protein [Flavobacteriales bacterium]QQS71739.1 MAG: hypothetical protein IPP95_11155 [Flavobacteriales bacterium]
MNTAKRTLLSAAIAAALICCCSLHANAMDGAPEGVSGAVNVLRIEPVDMFLMPTIDTVNTSHRTVRAGADGQFHVQVTAADGTLMMEGSYSDVECLVQNGLFTYYYGNGQVSDRGYYEMGTKTGTWMHFDARKIALAAK